MSLLRKFLMIAGTAFAGTPTVAQSIADPSYELGEFTQHRIRHQKILGITLGSYALANIAIGTVAASQTSGESAYFHRMNAYWNLVNLGIAGVGLLGARKRNNSPETLANAVRKHENLKQLLLVNAGLDVAYVVGGAYLQERAFSHPDNAEQLRGYGSSIIVQGSFLLAFDLVNYFIAKKRDRQQERLLLTAGPTGIGLAVRID